MSDTIETCRRNLATLQNTVLKDNTVMPHEWIGGRVFIAPPVGDTGQPKTYSISITLGGDVHSIEVTQEAIAR
jgi:hypothetical protein